MSNIELPTDPKEKAKLKGMLSEMTHCLQRIDDEKEQKADIAGNIKDAFSLEKRQVNKLASVMYKHNYADIQAENEHFEYLYESLVEGKKVVPSSVV